MLAVEVGIYRLLGLRSQGNTLRLVKMSMALGSEGCSGLKETLHDFSLPDQTTRAWNNAACPRLWFCKKSRRWCWAAVRGDETKTRRLIISQPPPQPWGFQEAFENVARERFVPSQNNINPCSCGTSGEIPNPPPKQKPPKINEKKRKKEKRKMQCYKQIRKTRSSPFTSSQPWYR